MGSRAFRCRGAPLVLIVLGAVLWAQGMRVPGVPAVIDLGTLGGGYSAAEGLNDRGDVVGGADDASGQMHAFLWRNGRMEDLGTLGGIRSRARAVNNRCQVVGRSATDGGQSHAFLWEQGTMRDLGHPPGDHASGGMAINDRGQVIVASGSLPELWDSEPFDPWTFLWEAGHTTSTQTLLGGCGGATRLNERGDLVGTVHVGAKRVACVRQDGKILQVGRALPPQSYGAATNARGDVAVVTLRDSTHPRVESYLWSCGRLQRLGPGRPYGGDLTVSDLNDEGLALGRVFYGGGEVAPVLVRGRRVLNLDFVLRRGGASFWRAWPYSINNRGEVVGAMEFPDGTRAFLLSGVSWM